MAEKRFELPKVISQKLKDNPENGITRKFGENLLKNKKHKINKKRKKR